MSLAVGIIGTLLGVVLGAILTRWIDFQYERRREVRQGIASALVLQAELDDARAGLMVIIKHKGSAGGFLFPGLQAWDEHREILLGIGMKHSDWLELAGIFRHLLEVAPILKEARSEVPVASLEGFESVKADCEKGIALLKPFAVEGTIPFLVPEGVFRPKSRLVGISGLPN